MIILGNLLHGLAQVLNILLEMMVFIIIARAIVSWVNADPANPIVRFLAATTDPLLRPIRRYVPPLAGGIDLSPIVLLLAIYLVKYTLVGILMDYSMRLRMPH